MNLSSGLPLAAAITSSAPSAALVQVAGPPPATASTGEFAQALGALEPGLNGLETGLNALKPGLDTHASSSPSLPEIPPEGGAELPGGKILPLGGIAVAAPRDPPLANTAAKPRSNASAAQSEFPAGPDAVLAEAATGGPAAPEPAAEHATAAGDGGREPDVELVNRGQSVQPLVEQVSASALVLPASPIKADSAPAESLVPLGHPPAVGLRVRTAGGEPLPRGIEVAESAREQRATRREAVIALLAQPGSGALSAEAAGSAPGAEVATPQAARAELPGMAVSAPSVIVSTSSQPGISVLPTAAAQIETLIDKLFAARESGQLARGEVLLRHAEFGAVALQLDQAANDWRATLSSRDPGFAPAAQAALAERAVLASADVSGGSSRGADTHGSQPGGARDPGGMASGDQRASHGRTGQQPFADLQPSAMRRSEDAASIDKTMISTVAAPARGQFA